MLTLRYHSLIVLAGLALGACGKEAPPSVDGAAAPRVADAAAQAWTPLRAERAGWPPAASDALGQSVTVTGLSPEGPDVERCTSSLVKCVGAFALGTDGLVPVRVSGPKGTIVNLQNAWVVLGDGPVDTRIDLLAPLLLTTLDATSGQSALVDVAVTAPDGSSVSGDLVLTTKVLATGLMRVASGSGGFVLPGEPPAPPKPARAFFFEAKPALAWSEDQHAPSAPSFVNVDVVVVQETTIRTGPACRYVNKKDQADQRTLYQKAADASFVAYDRRSGKPLGKRKFAGPLSTCPETIDADTGGLPIFENQAAIDWLLSLTPGSASAEPLLPRNRQDLGPTALTAPTVEPAEARPVAAALAKMGYIVRPDVLLLGGDSPKGFVIEARRGRDQIIVSSRDYAGGPVTIATDRVAVWVKGLPEADGKALAAKIEAAKPWREADLTALLEAAELSPGSVYSEFPGDTNVFMAAVKSTADRKAPGAQPVVDVTVIGDGGVGRCIRTGTRYLCASMGLGSTVDVTAELLKGLAPAP